MIVCVPINRLSEMWSSLLDFAIIFLALFWYYFILKDRKNVKIVSLAKLMF